MQRFSAFLDVLHGDLARAQELRDRTLADTEAWSAFQDNVRLLQEVRCTCGGGRPAERQQWDRMLQASPCRSAA